MRSSESVASRTPGEFAAAWPVVMGANLGIAIGAAMAPMLAISVFMGAFQQEFGWTRTEISLGSTILFGVLAASSPLIGWAADRIRSAWIAAIGLVGLAISYWLLSKLDGDLWLFYLACAGTAVAGSGAGTTTFARAVSDCFVRHRGLALGMAMVGTGFTAMLMPSIMAPYAAHAGWRAGYLALALIVACAAPLAVLLLLRAPAPKSRSGPGVPDRDDSLLPILTDRLFWTLAICFFAIPLSLAGMLIHLLALLNDAHVDAVTAGGIVGSTGVIQIICRLLSGWLVDRMFAPRVAAVMMTVSAVLLALVALFGAVAAWLAPIAFGVALGTEIDLLGYLTARYYGMRRYGRIYGLLYAATMVGSAMSPAFYGASFDYSGSYRIALSAGATLLVMTALLFLTLPRFPKIAD